MSSNFLPPQNNQNQNMPQGQIPSPQAQQWRGPAFMAQPRRMVQRLSNKMAALRRPGPAVDPNPLERYRAPQQPPMPAGTRVNRPLPPSPEPWQLSRNYKIARMMRKRRAREYENGPNGKRIGTIISSVIAALLLISFMVGGISSYTYYQNQLPQLQGLANMQIEQSTHFYDRNGNLLYTLYDTRTGRSIPVAYNEIPGYLQDAQIAAEDKTFWTNNGVDPNAIVRSAFIDANAQAAQTGASTLTQQVIKNLIAHEPQNIGKPPDRSVQNKISEAALAVGLTQQYPKWKVMEMYFNISPYGAQEQGVEAAAQDYFGLKPVCNANFQCTPAIAFLNRDLSKCTNSNDETTCAVDPILGLARASLLASIPQNPVIYDPTAHPAHPEFYASLLARQDYTLHQMQSAQMNINLGLGSQTNDAQVSNQKVVIDNAVIICLRTQTQVNVHLRALHLMQGIILACQQTCVEFGMSGWIIDHRILRDRG